MTARLASSVAVSALLRLTQQQGGFGTVLKKGDADSGAIILIIAERGETAKVLERLLQADGSYGWAESLKKIPNPQELQKFLQQRQRFDPDSWILELDVALAERFAAEMTGLD